MLDDQETKTACMINYLESKKESIHYVEMTNELKRLHPDIFPRDYTSKNTASILSHQLTRVPNTRFVRLGKGYYTVN